MTLDQDVKKCEKEKNSNGLMGCLLFPLVFPITIGSGIIHRVLRKDELTILYDLEDATRYFREGHHYFHEGNIKQAINQFRRASKIDPSNPEVHDYLGKCYEKMGEYTKALREYEITRSLNPPWTVDRDIERVGGKIK